MTSDHARRTTRSNVVKAEMTSTAAVRPTTKAATVPTTTITTTVATTTVAEHTTMAMQDDVDDVEDDVTDDFFHTRLGTEDALHGPPLLFKLVFLPIV